MLHFNCRAVSSRYFIQGNALWHLENRRIFAGFPLTIYCNIFKSILTMVVLLMFSYKYKFVFMTFSGFWKIFIIRVVVKTLSCPFPLKVVEMVTRLCQNGVLHSVVERKWGACRNFRLCDITVKRFLSHFSQPNRGLIVFAVILFIYWEARRIEYFYQQFFSTVWLCRRQKTY